MNNSTTCSGPDAPQPPGVVDGMSIARSRPQFVAVPYALVDDETISPQAKAVYMVLDRHADYDSGATYVGKDRIARKCGYAKADSVDRYLAELRDKGWLSWRRRWRRTTGQVDAAGRHVHEYAYAPGDGYEPTTNLYVVHDRPTVPAAGGTPTPAAGGTPVPATGGTPVPAAGGTNEKQVNENQGNENQSPPSPPGGSAVTGARGAQAQPSLLPEITAPAAPQQQPTPQPQQPDEDAEFDQWWQHVPRKKSKGDARKAFRAARKRVPLQVLVDGMAASRAQWQREGRTADKLPYPATWLRGEGWEDQPDEWQAPAAQARGTAPRRNSLSDWLSPEDMAELNGETYPPTTRADYSDAPYIDGDFA